MCGYKDDAKVPEKTGIPNVITVIVEIKICIKILFQLRKLTIVQIFCFVVYKYICYLS